MKMLSAAGPKTSGGDYSCSTQNVAEARQYDRIVAYAS